MEINKIYCMSSFLALRHVYRNDVAWKEGFLPNFIRKNPAELSPVKTAQDIDEQIKKQLSALTITNKNTAILLSGGMDSAILASYMPKGATAYTLKSMVDGAVDEVNQAEFYAKECGLNLKIVEVYWQDYLSTIPKLMQNKKSPLHSIEPLIYKAMCIAKKDNIENILCGENADTVFGGFDGLLSKDWEFNEFITRYNYCDPSKILKEYEDTKDAYIPYKKGNSIDAFKFISEVFKTEGLNSYLNPAQTSGINLLAPFSNLVMGCPIDLNRIRNGESKYLIRDLFKLRFPNLTPNPKLPMPRAVKFWLKDWQGPKREEFKKYAIKDLSYDAKWLVFCLEQFLNLIEG